MFRLSLSDTTFNPAFFKSRTRVMPARDGFRWSWQGLSRPSTPCLSDCRKDVDARGPSAGMTMRLGDPSLYPSPCKGRAGWG